MTEKSTESLNIDARTKTAWREHDWETLFVTGVAGLSLLATLWMIFVSVTDANSSDPFRIIPAASVMLMIEVWLVLTLPVYGKLAFWGAFIFFATYLFFALPFAVIGLLPGEWAIVANVFSTVSIVCGLLLFRQRHHFFPPPTPTSKRRKPM